MASRRRPTVLQTARLVAGVVTGAAAALTTTTLGPSAAPAAAVAGPGSLVTEVSSRCNQADQVELVATFQNTGTEAVAVRFRPTVPIGAAVVAEPEATVAPGTTATRTFATGHGSVPAGSLTVEAAGATVEVPYQDDDCGGVDLTITWTPDHGPVGAYVSAAGAGCPPAAAGTLETGLGMDFSITTGFTDFDGGGFTTRPEADGTFADVGQVPDEVRHQYGDLAAGPSYPVQAFCASTKVRLDFPGGFTITPPPPVVRLAGADRYGTAAAVSAASFAPGVPVAFVATGTSYPDALAGTPAAVAAGGPVLLTHRDDLPAATAAELRRLAPGSIVVLGGPTAVSDPVVGALAGLTAGPVVRVAGADRFATAAAIADRFPAGGPVVFVATGRAFTDALAAGPVAGTASAPLLLVEPDHVPAPTAAALRRLAPQLVILLGGEAAVSPAVQTAIGGLGLPVVRVAGPNRYSTAVALSAETFDPGVERVYLATAENFPDALAGGAPAGLTPGPVLLVNNSCLPPAVWAEITRLEPGSVVLLGGRQVLEEPLERYGVCGSPAGPGALRHPS